MPDHSAERSPDTASSPSADGALLALRNEIQAHEDFDRSQSCLGKVFSHFHGSYSSSLDDLKDLESQAEAACKSGDTAKLQDIQKQSQQAIQADQKAVDWQNDINCYGSSFLKTASLFAKGEVGLAATVGTYVLDEVKPSDSAGARLTDAGLGLAKGLLLRKSFEFLGESHLSIAGKGALTSLSSRGLDAALTRSNYLDNQGNLSWDGAKSKVVGNLTDWRALGADVAVYGLAHVSMKGLSGVTEKSPFLSTVLTGTTFGGASGATSEILRQKAALEQGQQQGWDISRIIKRAAIQATLDSVAAAPGGVQADIGLRQTISQHAQRQLNEAGRLSRNAMDHLCDITLLGNFGQPQFAYAGAYNASGFRAPESRPLSNQVMMASALGLTEQAFQPARPPAPEAHVERATVPEAADKKVTLLDHLTQAETALRGLFSKPMDDRLEQLSKVDDYVQRLSKLPILDTATALKAFKVDELLNSHLKQVNVEARRRNEIEEKSPRDMSEEEADRFFGPQQFLEDLISSRMKAYGWDGKNKGTKDLQSGLSVREGIGLQNRVFSSTNDLLNKGLSNNPDVVRELEKAGLTRDRALRWYGIPMREGSAADHVGGDYLLINRSTGEYYPFDSTAQAVNMKDGAIVDSQLVNPDLMFTGKKANVPSERSPWLVATIGDDMWDRLVTDAERRAKLSYIAATTQVVKPQLDQDMGRIIGTTLAQSRGLNLFDAQLPSNDPTLHPTRKLYELWRFRQQINAGGLRDWARSISSSMGFVVQDSGLQQLSWLDTAFGRRQTTGYTAPIGIADYRRQR